MMDRDSITRTGARAPGVERLDPLARRCLTRASSLTQSREYTVKAVGTKDEGKPEVGQASSDIPALKPYWGKPAVRNFRGGDGNVGIIREPSSQPPLLGAGPLRTGRDGFPSSGSGPLNASFGETR